MFGKLLDALGLTGRRTAVEAAHDDRVVATLDHAGISIGFGAAARPAVPLVADADVDQASLRGKYVYAHTDVAGSVFYIGQGVGRRAWSRDRDRLWHRYVDNHLHGRYSVRILADGLSSYDADDLEGRWMAQENEGLVNVQNMARRLNMSVLNRRDALMAKNKALLAQARSQESFDRAHAIVLYQEAFELLKEFAFLRIETGLYAQLLAEHTAEHGPIGQITLLDRLTLCLVRAGRTEEACAVATEYFGHFKAERNLKAAQRVENRLAPYRR